ncbi:MAG: phosphatase PAP2 family protein [Acidobacteriota bacterium]
MRATPWERTFDRISELEIPICRLCHRCSAAPLRRYFSVVSKLGDGHYWYLILASLFLTRGLAASAAVVHVILAGLVCHGVYRGLKSRTARERPYAFAEGFDLAVPPLDRYSFPSGHTMHSVFFTLVVGSYAPALLWLLVPFTVSVAASRVFLGLHYPTDVAAGGLLGALIAHGSFLFF